MAYLLHVRYPSGTVQTVTFTSAFTREIFVVALGAAVDVRLEDVAS